MTGCRAWSSSKVAAADWLLPVPPAVVAEIEALAGHLANDERPILKLRADDFALKATRDLMTDASARLDDGPGFIVFDRFPVEGHSNHVKSGLAWLLGNLLGRVVAQKWQGTFLYDVRDSGKALQHGVRRSITNLAQDFHTDGPWLPIPPERIGLFCMQPADEGGESQIASLLHAIDRAALTAATRASLHQPVYWDRQAEHEPEDALFSQEPILFEDRLGPAVRWYPDYVVKGFEQAGARPPDALLLALEQVAAALADPAHHIEFKLEAGQLLYLDNRRVTHSRKAFRDVRAHRHYIRIWNRNQGTTHLEGRLPLEVAALA